MSEGKIATFIIISLLILCFIGIMLNWNISKFGFFTGVVLVIAYLIYKFFTKKQEPVFCKDCIYFREKVDELSKLK